MQIFFFSEEAAKIAARRFARLLQKLGNKVRFSNFRVVNVLGTCSLPFSINIVEFSRERREARYTYKKRASSVITRKTDFVACKHQSNISEAWSVP